MRCKYIAIIPAYEPGDMLEALLIDLKKAGFINILVNDGSSKAFSGIFRKSEPYAIILEHNQNLGKGCALKTGMKYILEKFNERCVVVTVDADGQHSPHDAFKLCWIAEDNPGQLVVGSRRLNKSVPLRSRFGNTVTRFVYRISTKTKVYDTQSGLRAFTSDMIPMLIDIPGERYEYEMNMLLEAAHRHIPIKEEFIQTIYINNNASSHFDTVKDSFRVYKEILKFSASSLIGFIVDYTLFCITTAAGASIVFSNIFARIISAFVNYSVNRRFVFKSNTSILKSAAHYTILAAIILCGNTILLKLLTDHLGINRLLAKIITEIIFFLLSWLIQRFIIFKNTKQEVKKN